MRAFTHVYERLGFSSRSGYIVDTHRIVEPLNTPYWPCHDGGGLDIVQRLRYGPWHVRRVTQRGETISEPMTLREALVRVKLGVM